MGNLFVYFHHRALSIKREPGTLQLLGVLYYHNNQLKEAEATWKEVLQLAPSNFETRSNYVSAFSFSFFFSRRAAKFLKGIFSYGKTILRCLGVKQRKKMINHNLTSVKRLKS